jgi:shikimate dehydrogenase
MGNPVAHSRSPFIHARVRRTQTGQHLATTRLLCAMDGFADACAAFARGGRGCNVTVPFKFEAAALATVVTPRVRWRGAANVLRFDAGGIHADNTDGLGLVADITRNAGVPLRRARLLLVGAGGAAAGVLGPLLDAQPAVRHITVANRTWPKAAAQVQRCGAGRAWRRAAGYGGLRHEAVGDGLRRGASTPPPAAWAAPCPVPA